MRFNFQALCAALVCQSVSSFAPNAKPAFAFLTSSSIAKSSSTCTTRTSAPTPLMLMLTTKTKTNHAILYMSNVMADDGEALQSLFSSHCDKDGLMTKNTLQTDIAAIKELLVRFFILETVYWLIDRWIDGLMHWLLFSSNLWSKGDWYYSVVRINTYIQMKRHLFFSLEYMALLLPPTAGRWTDLIPFSFTYGRWAYYMCTNNHPLTVM